MRKYKDLFPIFTFLLLFLSLGQSSQNAIARVEKGTLKLEPQEVNASIVDISKNRVVILDADTLGLSDTVFIKPLPQTLVNGRAVKVKGILKDGRLEVPLTTLGQPNLIPTGEYFIIAKSRKKILKAKFRYNAPTLIINKLQIPVPVSDEKLARIIRHQTIGNSEAVNSELGGKQKATIIIHNSKDMKNPAEGTTPIEIELTPEVRPTENGNALFYTADTFSELPKGVDAGKTPIIEARFKVPVIKGGEPQETSLLIAVPLSKTDKRNINSQDLGTESDAIAKVVLSTEALTKSKNIDPPPGDKTILGLSELTSGLTQNATSIPEALELLSNASRALGTGVAKSIGDNLKDIGDSNAQAEIALNATGIAPNIIKQSPEKAADTSNVKELAKEPDAYALGTVNKEVLPFKVSDKLEVDLIGKIGLPLGAIEPITNKAGDNSGVKENPVNVLKEQNGDISFKFNVDKAESRYAELDQAAKNGNTDIDPRKLDKLTVLPGTILDGSAIKNDIQYSISPGAILKGEAPTAGSLEIFPGAIVSSEASKANNIKFVQDEQYDGPSVKSLAASDKISVVPQSLADDIPPGAQVAGTNGFKPAKDSVFIAPSGKSNNQAPSSNELKQFNPTTQNGDFENAFLNPSKENNFIKNSPAAFLGILGDKAPTALNDLATSQVNKPETFSGPVTGIGDIVSNFQPQGNQADTGETPPNLNTLFGGGNNPTPSIFGGSTGGKTGPGPGANSDQPASNLSGGKMPEHPPLTDGTQMPPATSPESFPVPHK